MTRISSMSIRLAAGALRPRFLLWLAGMLCAQFALANTVSISPLLLDITPRQRVETVKLTNMSDKAVTIQAEALRWVQADGKERLEETENILTVPPIADIAAGETQVFRVSLRRPFSGASEIGYRLMLEDVTEETSASPGNIAIHIRHNLPLFVTPAGDAISATRWSLCAAPAGKGCVRLDNDGNRRIRFFELTLAGQGWQQAIQGGTVLAGAWKQWSFDLPAGRGQPARITAKTEQGEISANLSAPKP